eukprot:4566328-Amphidinium_carterae.1
MDSIVSEQCDHFSWEEAPAEDEEDEEFPYWDWGSYFGFSKPLPPIMMEEASPPIKLGLGTSPKKRSIVIVMCN